MNNKARVREYFNLMFTALKNTTDEVFTFFYADVVKKIKPSFRLKTSPEKTQKRTGMTRGEISAFIAIKMGQAKPSKSYLDRLTSFERFQKKGDIYQFQHETIVEHLNSL